MLHWAIKINSVATPHYRMSLIVNKYVDRSDTDSLISHELIVVLAQQMYKTYECNVRLEYKQYGQ